MASTSPPKVASAQTAKNSTKNAAPSKSRARWETGFSGSSLLEAQVDHLFRLRLLLDHLGRFQHAHREVDERLVVLGVIGLVRGAVLPGNIGRRLGEGIARLLHDAAHQLVGLVGLALDHVEGLEKTVDRGFYDLRVL